MNPTHHTRTQTHSPTTPRTGMWHAIPINCAQKKLTSPRRRKRRLFRHVYLRSPHNMRLRWLCSINRRGDAVLVQDFALVQFERLHDPDPSNGELRDTEAAIQIIVLCPRTFPDAPIGLRHILKNLWQSRQPVPFAASDARHTDFALQFSRTIACTQVAQHQPREPRTVPNRRSRERLPDSTHPHGVARAGV